jgi:cell division protein FtsA
MFSIGGRLFTKRIAEDLKITFNEAEEFKVKYSADQLSQIRKNEVKESINKDVQVWAYGVSIGLEEFLDDIDGFPDKIYLCGGGSMLPDIRDALIQFPWTRDLPFNRSPKVIKLMPEELANIEDPNQLMKDVNDITPASIARFTYEIHQDDI